MLTLLLLTFVASAAQTADRAGWLDRPLTNWNVPGASMPKAPTAEEPIATLIKRCQLQLPTSTAAERAIEAAGWIPFWNFDQQLVRDDVEIVGGMSAADGMCRPMAYNLFVFVGGRFAGTLSPATMNSRLDGSSGAVRVAPPTITVEFARYTATDPLCCPSSRVTVQYRIDRPSSGPIVAALEVRTTRP